MKRWPSEASVKFFGAPFFKKGATLTLVGASQREARETAQRFSRPVAHREGGFTEPSPPPTGGHLPQRGRRDLALRKQLVAHILGSPSGGRYVPVGRCPAADRGGSRDAVAARRLRGQAASLTGRSRGYRPYGRVRPGRWFLFRLPPIRARSRLFEKKASTSCGRTAKTFNLASLGPTFVLLF